MDSKTENAIEMYNIYKYFGGVHALEDVSLTVKKGEIHALVGENGAGKSTLVKILSGAYQKDRGEIYVNGKHFQSNNIIESHKEGIGIIYQEFALCPDLTVMDNIFLNRLTLDGHFINKRKLRKEAQSTLSRIGFSINVDSLVGDLTIAYQQIVEIAKTLSQEVKILVLDEPTAVLSPYETEQLFTVLQNLKEQGVSIVYISHRLNEVFSLSDRITILRDGKIVETVKTKDTTIDKVITAMIGKNFSALFPERKSQIGDAVMEVINIVNGDRVKGVSFTLHQGEILGITGLVGAGKTETARAIFGADVDISGDVIISKKKRKINSPLDAIKAGIGYLPESRKEDGVILENSVKVNMTMAALEKISNKAGLLYRNQEMAEVLRLIERLQTKTNGIDCNVSDLSGGNQQKISLSKWLFAGNKIIILDEPTRGVDVNAKAEIYKIINNLTREGIAIVLITSELEEAIGLCDRIIVLNKGMISGTLNREEFSREKLLNLSIGRFSSQNVKEYCIN